MASLSALYSDLNYWNGQVNALEEKIRKLKKRYGDVNDIKSTLKTTVNNNSSDVNSKIRSAGNKLDNSVNYSGKDSQLNAIMAGKDEPTLGSDNNLTCADGELQRELSDIERQMNEAENSLAAAKRKVGDIKAAIAAEERRQREEAARKAAEAIVNALKI